MKYVIMSGELITCGYEYEVKLLKQCPARVDIESLRSEKWNENLIISFREVKSEIKIKFTLFEK